MPTRLRSVIALASSVLLVAIVTACLPTGTVDECSGQVTTTTLVDCAWTTSTTTDPSASSSSLPTTTAQPTTTAEPVTTTTSTTVEPTTTTTLGTTTTTRVPGDINDPYWAYKGNVDGPKVLLVGDSISKLSATAVNAALHPDYATQVLGFSGMKLAAARYYLDPYPATDPDVVLIEFGTNDGNGILADTTGAKRAAWKATFLEYAAMFPPDTCFAPVTMPASRNYPAWDASQAELNNWLLATFPDAVDWNAFELGQRAAGYNLLGVDFIHPEGLGFSAYAATILGGVERCLAS